MNATEKDYELLENLGAKLHIATPTAKWGFKVEKDGVVLLDTIERAHSWTRNAYNLLATNMCGVKSTGTSSFGNGEINLKLTSSNIVGSGGGFISHYGATGNIEGGSNGGFVGLAGDASRGIVIGLGSTAYSFNNYALATQVVHGTAANQMAYATSTISKVFDSDTKKYNVTHSRVFNNNSSADIIVAEVGIIGCFQIGGSSLYTAMVCRDVLGTPVTVPPASKLTVSYTMSVQFPD